MMASLNCLCCFIRFLALKSIVDSCFVMLQIEQKILLFSVLHIRFARVGWASRPEGLFSPDLCLASILYFAVVCFGFAFAFGSRSAPFGMGDPFPWLRSWFGFGAFSLAWLLP
jgi:hypothetical protein